MAKISSRTKKPQKSTKNPPKNLLNPPPNRSKRPLIVGGSLLVLIVLTIAVTISLSKSPISALIAFAKSDDSLNDLKSSPSAALLSASTGDAKAETFRASGDNLGQALSRLSDRVQQSEDYKNYKYFRLDVAPFSPTIAKTIVENFPALSEHSYFLASGSHPKKLTDPTSPTDSDITNMLMGSSYYLASQVEDDGQFAYGHYLDTDEDIEGYSIPRHAFTLMAMIKTYTLSHDQYLLSKIESALDYLKNFTLVYDPDDSPRSYVTNFEKTEISLASTALTALAYADYENVTGSNRYHDNIERLVNGINAAHIVPDPNSSCVNKYLYFQALNLDFTIINDTEYYSRWYDGQATYALVEASKALNDPSLLDDALINLDAFIEKNYAAEEFTHWTLYAAASYLKARPESDQKYYQLVIDSMTPALSYLKDSTDMDSTGLESLVLTKQTLDLASEQGIALELPASFEDDLASALAHQLSAAAAAYRPISSTIFSAHPAAYANSFVVSSDHDRSRIDDNAHPMNALYNYLNLNTK
jgi:hypothetical protein